MPGAGLARSRLMRSWKQTITTVTPKGGRFATTEPSRSGAVRPLRHAPDSGAEGVEPLVDALIAAFDLVGIVDGADALGADGGEQHRHAGADVGRYHRSTAQPARTRHA